MTFGRIWKYSNTSGGMATRNTNCDIRLSRVCLQKICGVTHTSVQVGSKFHKHVSGGVKNNVIKLKCPLTVGLEKRAGAVLYPD